MSYTLFSQLSWRLGVIIALTTLIHFIATLAYAVRPAGVYTKKIALAFSVWNVVLLISTTANTIQAPILGKILDSTSTLNRSPHEHIDFLFSTIIFSATLGTVFAALWFPSFTKILARGIEHYAQTKSTSTLLKTTFKSILKSNLATIFRPSLDALKFKHFSLAKKHFQFSVLHTLTIMLWTVGVTSSLYAGYKAPHLVRTTANLTGVVNGIATIIIVSFIDPKIAVVTDRSIEDPSNLVLLDTYTQILIFTRIAGTLLAQICLVPCSKLIIYAAQIL